MPIKKCELNMLENGICGQNGEYCQGHECPFDAYEEEEVKKVCRNCEHFWEHHTGYGCNVTHYAGLKSFPFKKEMDCFEESSTYE